MDIVISKKDIAWGYIAIFFQMASGILVLPFVLRMLSVDEIGFNYILLTVGQIVSLFDFSFSLMFGRNLSYIFSGAQVLKKEGVQVSDATSINYHLLYATIQVIKKCYQILSILSLLGLLIFGTVYVYYVSDGFSKINNCLLVWVTYVLSTFFNVYFAYYNSLLYGCGKIMESKKSIIASKLLYIFLCLSFLYCNMGLVGLCLANLISPFLGRFLSFHWFYTKDLQIKIKEETVTSSEMKSIFSTIWFNTRKGMIGMIGAFFINKFGMFLSGLFLSLDVIASYGLMVQLWGIICGISQNYFNTKEPQMVSYKIHGDNDKLIKLFSFSIISFWILTSLGFVCVALLGPQILQVIKSNSTLPSLGIMGLYSIVILLESNHSICSSFIIVGNRVPPIAASVVPGFFIALLTYIFLKYTDWGIAGIIAAPGICQLAYNNWKWPKEALKDLNISLIDFISEGYSQVKLNLKKIYKYGLSKF